jgi:hypothetical protein
MMTLTAPQITAPHDDDVAPHYDDNVERRWVLLKIPRGDIDDVSLMMMCITIFAGD